jgi:intein/homing endonuclease
MCYYGDMAELLNSKRAVFPSGKQREFLLQSKSELCMSWIELAEICKTSPRNLNDWRNEKFSMSWIAVEKICKKRGCAIPNGIVLMDAYWYASKGASAGGRAIIEKYGFVGGDPEYRKKRWREWWEKEGRYNPDSITQPQSFRMPDFSKDLAEFVGILLGDGGISTHQISVTLHRITDKEYSLFVRKLIYKLFEITAGEYKDKQFLADSIVISRIGLVRYCMEKLGLKQGNKIKQQVDIPKWIRENTAYGVACLRGLIDTDGCVILHRYISSKKEYQYPKLDFTSKSVPLLGSASLILSELGIRHRITKNGFSLRIESKENVKKYFDTVGTSNQKHWKRYKCLK